MQALRLTQGDGNRELELCSQVQEGQVQMAALFLDGRQLWEHQAQTVHICDDVHDARDLQIACAASADCPSYP